MTPNLDLTPIKQYVRQHGGWGKRFAPAQPLPAADETGNRVFLIEPKILASGRRFAVVARNWEAAHDRLNLLMS